MILHDVDKIMLDEVEISYIYIDEETVYSSGLMEAYDEKLLYDETNIATEFNE